MSPKERPANTTSRPVCKAIECASIIIALDEIGSITDCASDVVEFLNFAEANYGDDSVRQMLAAEFEGDIGRLTMAVEELFQRPYWNRLWPVQEIVLARQISLQCGSVKIGWDSFLFWSYNTNAIRSATGDNSVSGKYWPIRRYEVDHLVQQRADAVTGAVSEGYNARHDLLALVQTHARKHCEDPRDRVYAMLSMANPVPSGLSVKLIEPDYEKSSEDLLFDLLTHARPDGRTGWLFLDSWLKSFKPAWLWASGLPSLDSLCHTIWNVPQAYRIKAYPVGKISKCWKAITVYGQGTSKRCHGFSIQTPLRYKNGRPETSRFTGLNGGEARPGDMAYNLQDLGGAGFIVRRIPGDAGLPQRSNVCGLEELFEFIGSTHCVNRLGTYDYVTPIDEATAVPDSLARDVVDLLRYNEFALKQHGAGDYPVLEMEIDRRTLTRILYMAKQATGFESSAQWKDLNWVALQSYWPRPEGADDKDNEP